MVKQIQPTSYYIGNPRLNVMRDVWEKIGDCYIGARAVKDGPRKRKYLPPSEAEIEVDKKSNLKNGYSLYDFRRFYAQYEPFFRPIADQIVGLMNLNKPVCNLREDGKNDKAPAVMQALLEYGNTQNDTIYGLKLRVNHNQTLYGRYGLLLDIKMDSNGRNPKFSISEYPARTILDGETRENESGQSTLEWVLLDESDYVFNRELKSWEWTYIWRVLGIDKSQGTPRYYQAVLRNDPQIEWLQLDINNPLATLPPENVVYPALALRTLEFIPFTVCNATRLGIDEWEEPPLADVAEMSLDNYRCDSLYKKGIYLHASPTVVAQDFTVPRNGDRPKFNLGGLIELHSATGQQASIRLMETSGSGLGEIRNAKHEIKGALGYMNVQAVLDGAGAGASGEALRIRSGAGTASMSLIDQTGSRAIEEQLCYAAMWTGQSAEEAAKNITFQSDTAYLGAGTSISEIVSLISANASGQIPFLSKKNLYNILAKRERGTISTYDDNLTQVIDEMYEQMDIAQEFQKKYPPQPDAMGMGGGEPMPDESQTGGGEPEEE